MIVFGVAIVVAIIGTSVLFSLAIRYRDPLYLVMGICTAILIALLVLDAVLQIRGGR